MRVIPQVRDYGWRHQKERELGSRLGRKYARLSRAPIVFQLLSRPYSTLPSLPTLSLLSRSHLDLAPTPGEERGPLLCSPHSISMMKPPEGPEGSCWEQEDRGAEQGLWESLRGWVGGGGSLLHLWVPPAISI